MDLREHEEPIPAPLAERSYSGRFVVRVPPETHRELVIQAAEEAVSLNRLVSTRLTAPPAGSHRITPESRNPAPTGPGG